MKRRICAGNWKMNKTLAEAIAYVDRFSRLVSSVPQNVEVVLCPPFTALEAVGASLRSHPGGNRIKLGAQNMHWAESGAYTGEVSAPMLLELGVEYVILGHSERRMYFGETDESVRLKTQTALHSGLIPIVAVGESLGIREAGEAKAHVVSQVRAAIEGLGAGELERIVIAYEPIWAIGTGRNCDAPEADEIMRAIRDCAPALHDVPVLYGGSVKPDNIAAYTSQSNIDGALVGGASLDPDDFARLASEAA